MKVLQINTAVNTGSTGRIAERIGLVLLANGEQSIIAYGRGNQPSASETIKIGTRLDYQLHGLKTRLLDKHAFGSKSATQKLIAAIEAINPDIINLHNLHGYYIHVGVLFSYLKKANKPVVWTLHDCWPFTGHCSYFSFVKCDKWKTQCHHCPLCRRYPQSLFIDNSFDNYIVKKELFNGLEKMTLVTPSNWLRGLLKESFLKAYPVQVIHNGVDLKKFIPLDTPGELYRGKIGAGDRHIILGIASIWDRRKGFNDFLQLAAVLNDNEVIVLVGLKEAVIKTLPANIIGIPRTESMDELVTLYNTATVFVNPTWVDNFPTTNIEALACGTPVITYRTGGSIEAIDENTGFIVEQGDIEGIRTAMEKIKSAGKNKYSVACRQRAEALFNETDRFADYYQLYKKMSGIEEGKRMMAQ
jgi:putative colanic acid biosynthesis glycosyltransferase